jgi:hypothetical protein
MGLRVPLEFGHVTYFVAIFLLILADFLLIYEEARVANISLFETIRGEGLDGLIAEWLSCKGLILRVQ